MEFLVKAGFIFLILFIIFFISFGFFNRKRSIIHKRKSSKKIEQFNRCLFSLGDSFKYEGGLCDFIIYEDFWEVKTFNNSYFVHFETLFDQKRKGYFLFSETKAFAPKDEKLKLRSSFVKDNMERVQFNWIIQFNNHKDAEKMYKITRA